MLESRVITSFKVKFKIMNNIPNNQYHSNNDEIDLFELCITLWKNKWTIVGITLAFTIIAGILAFVIIKPTYQSEIEIAPPFQYQYEILNKGVRAVSTKLGETPPPTLPAIDQDRIYSILINNLNANNTQRDFFQNHYLKNYENELENTQENFNLFKKNLLIKQANKDSNYYTISFKAKDAENALNVTRDFLSFAEKGAKEIVLKNREAELNALINNFQNSILVLQAELTQKHDYEIEQLQNALSIAQKLNIIKPEENITEAYMQGSEVLSAKLKSLKENVTNFSENNSYNELVANINVYKTLQLPSINEFNIFQVNATPEIPEKPIKPNKKLIVIIGFFLGGILAVLFVLIRQAIRNRLSIEAQKTHD